MNHARSVSRTITSFLLVIATLTAVNSHTAYAATVVATGTDAGICNQEVSDATNVTAVRLAGGDCVVSFNSGTVSWTVPANLKRIKILLVGGGGGGGGSYDTAGAGGGGAGQALLINSREITAKVTYQITVGNGGAGGFHIARTNSVDAIGVSGTSSSISFNSSTLHTAFGGGGGGSSRANGPGTSSRVGGAAATLNSGGVGGGPGGGGYSGGGGGGSSGAGANGSTAAPGLAVTGGAGTSIDISGTAISYGVGGAGGVQDGSSNVNGVAGAANTGNGGSGASVSTGTYRNGGAGGSGVVIIRYSTTAPTFSNLSISGNVSSAVLRQVNTISATVNVPSLLTFLAGKSRIAGCISLPTSGSSTNNVATCSWKPTVKGPTSITVEAVPLSAGISGISTNTLNVAVIARSTRR